MNTKEKAPKHHHKKSRPGTRPEHSPRSSSSVDKTLSTPEFKHFRLLDSSYNKEQARKATLCTSPRDDIFASECNICPVKDSKFDEILQLDKNFGQAAKGDDKSSIVTYLENMQNGTGSKCVTMLLHPKDLEMEREKVHGTVHQEKGGTCCVLTNTTKKSRASSPFPVDAEDPLIKLLRDIHNDTRKSARIIRDSKARLQGLQKKRILNEADIKELGERNELLLREMERFDRLTKTLQKLVGAEVEQFRKLKADPKEQMKNIPTTTFDFCAVIMEIGETTAHVQSDSSMIAEYRAKLLTSPRWLPEHNGLPQFQEELDWRERIQPYNCNDIKMSHPAAFLTGGRSMCTSGFVPSGTITRSKSEIDLTRKLSESYDMQEKLVADNADLEVKRYILYKELMTKDQNLETSRAQIKRLQGELKLLNIENSVLLEKLHKNNPEGDATVMSVKVPSQQDFDSYSQFGDSKSKIDVKSAQELVDKLENYKSSTLELEKQLGELEFEVRYIRTEMDSMKGAAGSACRGGSGAGPNSCFQQPHGVPPVTPMTRACGVCPPCPAPCNPNAPPTPAEKEVQKLSIQLQQTQESFKTKVSECAMLRADLLKKKAELEKERCQHRETENKLRELEMRFEGLTTHTNMLLGTKEQALEQEVNVRTLKQCYREAREEIDELRTLMKEQNDQLQDYRVKYLHAQQLVEEQKRQMDMMDMDNTRISEQINLEIQRVKIKFQEKLQELAPIPDLLKATQMRLKDAQQSQAIAEHNAEQLARELNCAREKVHVLLHNITKPAEKPPERSGDEKQMALLQQRISQLTETNVGLKNEIERLKANVIRMEESVLANEKRLQEKMHECAQFGGELDRARDEAARALQRANERTETLRKCMQTTIAELERQLAVSRAQVRNAEKEREEIQCRMQCQIKRLNENFEQAQLRILGLQGQVQTLRRTVSSTDGEGDGDIQECACKGFFENS